MNDMKPLLCNTQVVQNIYAGVQTQDRRLVKGVNLHKDYGQPNWNRSYCCGFNLKIVYDGGKMGTTVHTCKAPWQPGDILYVREKWRVGAWDMEGKFCIDYATGPRKEWIEIYTEDNDFDGEKVNDLILQCSDEAMAAGMKYDDDGMYHWNPGESPCRWRPSIHMPKTIARIFLKVKRVWVERIQDISEEDCRAEGVDTTNASVGGYLKIRFSRLWDSIYPGSWDRNEWVFAMEFERTEKP